MSVTRESEYIPPFYIQNLLTYYNNDERLKL